MAFPVISIAAARSMSEYEFEWPQRCQPTTTSKLDVMNANHHMPMKTGTLPCREVRPSSGSSNGSLPCQISLAICFGQTSETIGTNQAPIAQAQPVDSDRRQIRVRAVEPANKDDGRDEVDRHLDQDDEVVPDLGGVELIERRASGSGSVGEPVGGQSGDDGDRVDQAGYDKQPLRPRGTG
jgi:hypothetical protein